MQKTEIWQFWGSLGERKPKIQISLISLFTIEIKFLLQNIFIGAILSIKVKKTRPLEEFSFLHPRLYGLRLVIRLAHAEISTGK